MLSADGDCVGDCVGDCENSELFPLIALNPVTAVAAVAAVAAVGVLGADVLGFLNWSAVLISVKGNVGGLFLAALFSVHPP